MARADAANEVEQKLLDDVAHYGWHCLHVNAEEGHQPFSYTVGLFQTHGHPELLIYGLSAAVAHGVLRIAADAAARLEPLDMSVPTDALLEGYPCVFVEVPKSEYREHLGFALWYYEGDQFPVQQVVYPSRAGLFPWHAAATDGFRVVQPVLGQPAKGD